MPVIEGIEIDHVFVSAPAKEQDVALLTERGLVHGASRVHKGQGTANACFYFDNVYLELIWLHDETEIRSATVEPLALWERTRWRRTGACPFGVAFRLRDGESDWPPLVSWEYDAPFLPGRQTLPIVTPRGHAKEPMAFFSSRSPGPPAGYPPGGAVPLEHASKRRTLRRVCLQLPSGAVSEQIRALGQSGLLNFEPGGEYHMRLEFEGGNEEVDFRPSLPLSLLW